MTLPRLLVGGLLALLLSVPAYSSPARFAGLPITNIDITDDQGRPWPRPEQVLPLIGLKPGSVFSSTVIREGISFLYLKGLFKDIRVEVFSEGNGVRVAYRLVPITVVKRIEIHGNHALSDSTIRELLPSVEEKELRSEKLLALKADLLERYQAEGYYDVTIDFRSEPLPEPYRVALHVDIRESTPTRIEEIAFSGSTVFQDRELLALLKSKKGSLLTRDVVLDRDRDAILGKYAAAQYPAARIDSVNISFRSGKAYLFIAVNEGPAVTVTFTGNHEVGSGKLKRLLLIWPERSVSDAVIDSSVDAIKNFYREKGHATVTVDVKKKHERGRLDLEFIITEGPRVIVKEVLIHGNTVFTTKQIKKQMALREPGWFADAPYREDLLENDANYLQDRYVDAGHLTAGVKKKVALVSNGTEAVVTVEINEGPHTSIGTVSFEGNRFFSSAELLDKLMLKPGASFNELTADEDRYRILSAYSNRGYLYARVDVEKKPHDNTVDITYRITEDKPVTIGRIILRGNERTKDEVIMRELLVKQGDTYDYGNILASQQRIYRLGYFRVAKFEPVRPGEKEYVQDMLFTVEERPAGAVEFGLGYGDLDRLRGFAEISYRNLWGTARYTSLRYEQSDILKRSIFNFKEPWFLNRDLEGKFSLVWSDSERLNSDTRETYYKTRKTSASFGVEKTYQTFKPSLTYQFENVVNYDMQPAAELTPEDSGRVLVSSLIPALILDLRDDAFNPHKGALYGITFKEALRELGSQAAFTKLTVQGGWFLPVARSVVALSTRFGMAWPFSETPEVPIHERFYLGGSTTVRGYRQDSIGPSGVDSSGNQIPIGGASMAAFSIELRLNPGEGLGFVLFSDAGNVWPGQTINFEDLRSSYGIGIRYGTPIGPLRLDYGQKIHRRTGESPGELHFNIGHMF